MDYRPGDIVNGHVLGSDNQWHPLPPAPPTPAPQPRSYGQRYRARWRKTFWSCCGVALLGAFSGPQRYSLLDIIITVPLMGSILGALVGLIVAIPKSATDYPPRASTSSAGPAAEVSSGNAPGVTWIPQEPGDPALAPSPGPARRWRRWTRRRRLALFGVGVVLLIAADLWQANREMDNLLTAIQASVVTMSAGTTNFNNVTSGYTADTYMSDQQRADLINQAESSCAQSAAAVEDAQSVVEGVTVLPWHRSLADAKAKFLQLSNLVLGRYRDCATGPATWFNKAVSSEIVGDVQITGRAFRDAEPIGGDHSARITAIFGS